MTKKLKSFTLVEILLYIGLAVVIIYSTSTLLITIFQIKAKNQIILEVENQGSDLIQSITQSVRAANSVTSPAPGSAGQSLTLAMADPSINPTIYNLASPAPVIAGPSPSLAMAGSAQGPTITNIASQIAQVTEGATPAIALTTSDLKVENLNFQTIDNGTGVPNSVKIDFSLEYSTNDARYEFNYKRDFSETVNIRVSP